MKATEVPANGQIAEIITQHLFVMLLSVMESVRHFKGTLAFLEGDGSKLNFEHCKCEIAV